MLGLDFKQHNMAQKSRAWCYTLNNWTQDEFNQMISIPNTSYTVVGKEIGEKGTPHLQGYIYFNNPRALNGLKRINSRIHWEIAKGDADQNFEYCSKDNDFVELGKRPKQGERIDLVAIRNRIFQGERVEDLLFENPGLYHIYGRTMVKLEDMYNRSLYRTKMTTGKWYWGETGGGKSHIALSSYNPLTHYLVPNDGGWWDGYIGQPIVVFNDFRGELSYNNMLQLVDKWPVNVRRRNREPMPFTSLEVIITSSLPPWDIYNRRTDEDSIEQLLRRFRIFNVSNSGTLVVEGNTIPPPIEDPTDLLSRRYAAL